MKRLIQWRDRSSNVEWMVEGDRMRFRFDDGDQGEASIVEVSPGAYSILVGSSSYDVRVDGATVEIRGETIAVAVIDPRASVLAARSESGEGQASVRASMPGKVIRLLAAAGDQVQAGQGLVVVEAMKMQNELKSPKAGRVVSIGVREAEAVTAGQMLAVVE